MRAPNTQAGQDAETAPAAWCHHAAAFPPSAPFASPVGAVALASSPLSAPLEYRFEQDLPALDIQAGDYLELFGADDLEDALDAAFAAAFADAGLQVCSDPRGGFILRCLPGGRGMPGVPTRTSPAAPLPSAHSGHARMVLHRVRRVA